jgi:hypothetical protein
MKVPLRRVVVESAMGGCRLACARGDGGGGVERVGRALRGDDDMRAHERRNRGDHESVEAPLRVNDDVHRNPDEAAVPFPVVQLLRDAKTNNMSKQKK